MKTFEVTVFYGDDLPLIGEVARVRVDAYTHREASDLVRTSREWPWRCVFTPRIVNDTPYQQHFLCSQSGALLDRMPRLTGAA
jgi:hypothetical protein